MRRGRNWLLLLVLFGLVITSCAAQPEPAPVAEELPLQEATEPPPPTPEPTETPLPPPTPTPLPTGLLFRDEFDGGLQEGWVIQNEDKEKYRFTDDGWLEITAGDEAMLGEGVQTNVLLLEIPEVEQFEINTHLIADTTSNFQQAAIFVIEDSDNFLVINRGHCSICPTQGDGIYTDYQYDGVNGSFKAVKIDVDEIYLRLQFDRAAGYLTAFYATEPDRWIQLRKIPIDLNYQQVGLGATNIDVQKNLDDDLIARFDYFEIWDLSLKEE